MARTRLELLAEGSIVTVILIAFVLAAFPLVSKGEGVKREGASRDFSLGPARR